MTRQVNITNLSEIKTLRFKCNKCLTVIEFSIGANAIIQKQCLSCGANFDTLYFHAISKVKEGLKDLRSVKDMKDDTAEIEILTEIEE